MTLNRLPPAEQALARPENRPEIGPFCSARRCADTGECRRGPETALEDPWGRIAR